MDRPKRIDRLIPNQESAEPSARSERGVYLIGIIDAVTELLSDSHSESWVGRSMIQLDPDHPEIPADDQDKPGRPIEELISRETGSVTFLVGESGSGKSSVIRYLGRSMAESVHRDSNGPVPIFVSATDLFAVQEAEQITASEALTKVAAAGVRSSSVTAEVVFAVLSDRTTPFVVFIDGLDSEYLTGRTTSALSQLLSSLQVAMPNAKYVATCRQEIWSDASFAPRNLGAGYLLRLLGMRDIAEVVTRWWNHNGDHGLPPQAIITMLTSDNYLSSLCRSPLMLGYTLSLIEQNWTLPESVGGICQEIIGICLSANGQPSSVRFPQGGGREELDYILSRLAWRLAESGSAGDVNVVDGDQTLVEVQNAILASSPSPRRAYGGAVPEYTELFRRGIGIFGEIVPGAFGFRHDAFELYFAGQYLSTLLLESSGDVSTHLSSAHAGPCLRVWAEASAHDGCIDQVLVLIEELLEYGGTAEALVGAELLAAAERVVADVRSRWATRWTPRIQQRMKALRLDRLAPLVERMRAGDVLARLGDDLVPASPETTEFFMVGATSTMVGRKLPASTIDRKYQRRHWSEPSEVDLPEVRISRFPVTNAEYRRFVEAGGYDVPHYWAAEGAPEWQAQDEVFLATLAGVVAASFDVHYSKDVEGDFMNVLDHSNLVDEFCDNLLRRETPLYWLDGRYNNSNQPVVGVNWWEANAYCAWMTERLRAKAIIGAEHDVRLLTEQEWEYCAASGSGHNYPWGDDWRTDSAHVRTQEAWITRAVAIGCFPWSKSTFGPECMVGNVWEWCLSEAPTPPTERFAAIQGGGPDRTTRGSSWLSKEPLARNAAFRSWDPPCNAYVDLSFRVAMAPIDYG